MNQDGEILGAVFAARVMLAKKTPEQVITDAIDEFERTLMWVASNSKKEHSFLWYCDEFDLDPGAVRKAIKERQV